MVTIRRLDAPTDAEIDGLAALLVDAVTGGAAVGFLAPLTHERARRFWSRTGSRLILVAEDEAGIAGTVTLSPAGPENQPHRGDLSKMLVHRRARRTGLGGRLLHAAEELAVGQGWTLLVLDAVPGGDGARLYERHGWIRVGDIPNYAMNPDGSPGDTTVFYRDLRRRAG
jgi:GNAT superfamily N-acetyltransferase